jgi:hypothetical protein
MVLHRRKPRVIAMRELELNPPVELPHAHELVSYLVREVAVVRQAGFRHESMVLADGGKGGIPFPH